MRIFTIEIFDMNNENTIIIESHKFFNFVAGCLISAMFISVIRDLQKSKQIDIW